MSPTPPGSSVDHCGRGEKAMKMNHKDAPSREVDRDPTSIFWAESSSLTHRPAHRTTNSPLPDHAPDDPRPLPRP
jgi:hypothetical protein